MGRFERYNIGKGCRVELFDQGTILAVGALGDAGSNLHTGLQRRIDNLQRQLGFGSKPGICLAKGQAWGRDVGKDVQGIVDSFIGPHARDGYNAVIDLPDPTRYCRDVKAIFVPHFRSPESSMIKAPRLGLAVSAVPNSKSSRRPLIASTCQIDSATKLSRR